MFIKLTPTLQETSEPPNEIPYRAELLRKSLHLIALIIPVGMFYLGRETALYILVPLSIFAISIEYLRTRSETTARFIDRTFGWMMRTRERTVVGSPFTINGATWVVLSATILALIFPIQVASFALGSFMISDAGAALAGRRFGRHHWGVSKKTMEGSLVFFILATLCLLCFDALTFVEAAGVAFIAMLLEIAPLPFNDNLYVPFGIAGLIYLLNPGLAV